MVPFPAEPSIHGLNEGNGYFADAIRHCSNTLEYSAEFKILKIAPERAGVHAHPIEPPAAWTISHNISD